MDKPISVGDLVQIVRPALCCGSTNYLGWMFKVSDIATTGTSRCTYCGVSDRTVDAQDAVDGLWTDIKRLKRIPPLDELEGKHSQERIKLPGQPA